METLATPDDHRERAAREDRWRTEGAASERAKLAPVSAALSAAAARVEAAAGRLEESTKSQILELVKAIVGEVLRREVADGRYDLAAIVRDGLRVARNIERGAVVRLHPQDYEAAAAGGVLRQFEGSPVRLQADPSVERAGCRVDTPYGEVVRELSAAVADVFAAVEGKR
jgi:flagellar assembly protein FliH